MTSVGHLGSLDLLSSRLMASHIRSIRDGRAGQACLGPRFDALRRHSSLGRSMMQHFMSCWARRSQALAVHLERSALTSHGVGEGGRWAMSAVGGTCREWDVLISCLADFMFGTVQMRRGGISIMIVYIAVADKSALEKVDTGHWALARDGGPPSSRKRLSFRNGKRLHVCMAHHHWCRRFLTDSASCLARVALAMSVLLKARGTAALFGNRVGVVGAAMTSSTRI